MPVGKITEFNPASDDFESWMGVLINYLHANDVDETKDASKAKAIAILLSSVGVQTYFLLQGLVSPAKPEEKTFDALVKVLTDYYKPAPKAIAERFKFYNRKQQPGESVSVFVLELRKLAVTCKFTDLDTSLRDQLVVGLQSEDAQKHLFLEDDFMTLAKAVAIAKNIEAAGASATMVRNSSSHATVSTNKVKSESEPQSGKAKGKSKKKGDKSKCFGCGGQHLRKDCPHSDVECHSCGNMGHFARYCPSKSKEGGKVTKKVTIVKQVSSRDQPIFVDVRLNAIHHSMELDTASGCSFITPDVWKKLGSPKLVKSDISFRTYTGQKFEAKGKFNCTVEYNSQSVTHEIHVAEGSSLFGRDLLNKLQMDWSQIKRQCSQVCKVQNEISLSSLLDEYSDVFNKPVGVIKGFKAKLVMKENAVPRFFKARSIPFSLRDKVDKELDKMEQSGAISRVETSEWASPLVVVPKANGSVRITGDFKRTINNQLHIQQYPLARVEELFEKISGGQLFTKLDGPDAFHQVEVDDSCKPYLVINTHRGLYRYNVLPQGIASSPAIFQELMDRMLKNIPMCGSFVDDTIGTGKDDQEHLGNLKKILHRMREWNFRLSKQKCIFMQPEVNFLGQVVCAEGIRTDPSKVESIMSMREPRDGSEVKSFLGLVNFYSKFIPNLSHLCEPLNNLTREGVEFVWSTQCRNNMDAIKKSVSSAPVLAHYNQSLPIGIACDASSVGLGVVLFHRYADGTERPIAYASKTLSSAERNYSQVEKEGLSIIFGVKRFTQYLYGRRFILVTDHNPLLAIFGQNRELPSLAATRLHRWAMFLSGFLYDIEYRNTHRHGNADALSRLPLPASYEVDTVVEQEVKSIAIQHPVTSKSVREKTSRDPVLAEVIRHIKQGWPGKQSQVPECVQPFFNHRHELNLEQGIVMWGIRVVVPKSLHSQILVQLHDTHPGIVRMKSLARTHVWWPGIDSDIESLVKSCVSCSVNRDNPAPAPLHPWSFPEKAWQRLHVDLAGPFLNNMWLVVVDAYSKWPEVFKLGKDSSSSHVIRCIRECISRFGIPDTIVSDNGPQFVSNEFEQFCSDNGIRHTKSSAYHPRSNGEAERFVRTFKNGMKACNPNVNDNLDLCNFLMTYRITPHATTGASPSELMMKRPLKTLLDLLHPDVDSRVKSSQEKQQLQFNKSSPVREFFTGDKVWVQTFGKDDKKWSLGTVVKSVGPVSYVIQVENRTIKRHVDHILSAEVTRPCSPVSSDPVVSSSPPLQFADSSDSQAEEAIVAQDLEQQQSSSSISVPNSRPKRVIRPPDRLNYDSFK